jgi:ParB family chromosome partitioning protein
MESGDEMSQIVMVPVGVIDANPFRLLGEYPYVERKLEALQRSFKDVGIWEGVIARPKGNRHQLAFGHHRIEAARRNGIKEVPLVVRELTDEQMLQFMGRENLEDYNADFLCMLETWEAGEKFSGSVEPQRTQPLVIARLLGWTRVADGEHLNITASACHAAHGLITGGYLSRDDLSGIPVSAAREIVERAYSRMEQLDRMGTKTQRPTRETEAAKKQYGKAAKKVAKESREGNVSQKDLRGKVDVEAYRYSNKSTVKNSPLFAFFADELAKTIARMLDKDSAAEKLAEIKKAIPQISLDEDKAALRKIDFALAEHEERTARWRKELVSKGRNVVPLALLKKA